MGSKQRGIWGLAAGCIVSVVLTGCSSSSSAGDSDKSPLEQYLGHSPLADDYMFGGGYSVEEEEEEIPEEERAKMRQVEELVQGCMAEQGFEYYPVSPDEQFGHAEAGPWSLEPEEFVKQYGYGLSTIDYEEFEGESRADDPNEQYRQGLSENAQEEYDKALYGDWEEYEEELVTEDGEPGQIHVPEPENPGCYDEAWRDVEGWDDEEGGGPEEDWEQWDDLWEEIDGLYERLENDPRMKDASQAWASCLAEQGYDDDFENTWAAQDSVWQKIDAAVEEELGPDYWEKMEEEHDGEYVDPMQSLDDDVLAEIQEYEIAIAAVDFACHHEHVTEARKQVAWELEEEFVAEHKAELERYRDEVGTR